MNAKKNTLAYEWSTINWKKVEISVFKLQKRIYQATERGDDKSVRRLQKLLLKSWNAKLLAVRKVTQDNKGKNTAGIDRMKSLTPAQRMKLVKEIRLHHKAKAVRRVYIPKQGSKEKRPLGIPTIKDRAMQMLVKLALEPEWEQRFEPNSYGFRPGRSAHDAVYAIFLSIKNKAKYVLDADIEKCFDKINHDKLIEKLNTFPIVQKLIMGWLKAGFIDREIFNETTAGTPQGGVISPLLANIALHGLENLITKTFHRKYSKREIVRYAPTVVRYADDFVILNNRLDVIESSRDLINDWLFEIGLKLKESKTSICHTLNSYDGKKPGFDFLGFNIRQYPVGKLHSGKIKGKLLGFKTLIKPSKSACEKHVLSIRHLIRKHRAASQDVLIAKLSPLIRGWAYYYRSVVASKTFSSMDKVVFMNLKSWAYRRHSNKGKRWIVRKYWQFEKVGKWSFETPNGKHKLFYHHDVKIYRHLKVRGNKSPYDGDWKYWSLRLQNYITTPLKYKIVLKRQAGKCCLCGLKFKGDEKIISLLITPASWGGSVFADNLELVHHSCHIRNTGKRVRNKNPLQLSLWSNSRGAV